MIKIYLLEIFYCSMIYLRYIINNLRFITKIKSHREVKKREKLGIFNYKLLAENMLNYCKRQKGHHIA
jgi:hypothetical protein